MKLSGKAENIDLLLKVFKNDGAQIPEFFYFSIDQFNKNKNLYINKIYNKTKIKNIIVRSSSYNEDKENFSNAGKYESCVLKRKSNIFIVSKLINNFVKQFKSKKDKIIIQEYITNVDFSGVIFTKDINYDSPYYTINYDNSGKTNLITSGEKNDKIKSLIIYKNFSGKIKIFRKLIEASKKLEKITNNERLDIEFSLKNKKLILFQVRPLPKPKYKVHGFDYKSKDFDEYLLKIKKKINKLKSVNPTLNSKETFFSNMSDWNPAEMIGDKPTPLGLSLYRELITDEIWREQRMSYGYKNVFPNPLLFSFAGSPYIDLRTDITSFLPINLNEKITSEIVSKYLKILKNKPEIHDKIEFELVETCYSFLSSKRLRKFFSKKISNKYLKELKNLTKDLIKNQTIFREKDKVDLLKNQLDQISKSKSSIIQKIFYIVKLTKNFGTSPFSGLARCAFISQRILLDLKNLKLISDQEFDNFFKSLNSLTHQFNNDIYKLKKKNITKKNFLRKYGHLRPSTYDINNLNYSEGFNKYFSNKNKNSTKFYKKKKFIKFKNAKKIDLLFKKNLNIDLKTFLNFASNSIVLREKSKLDFTRGINLIFEYLLKLGKRLKIKREDLSFLDFKTLMSYYSSIEVINLKKLILNEITKNKFEYNIMKLIKLPDFIKTEYDIYKYFDNISKPNFITLNSIFGETIELKDQNLNKIKGKILLIKNADPGYDFVFNYEIKGLITQYGGANSHMAIRCLELNIPAAIGVGQFQYENLKLNKKIMIDCAKKNIKIL